MVTKKEPEDNAEALFDEIFENLDENDENLEENVEKNTKKGVKNNIKSNVKHKKIVKKNKNEDSNRDSNEDLNKNSNETSDEKYSKSELIELRKKVKTLFDLKPDCELKETASRHIDNAVSCCEDELYEQAYCHLWKAIELLWKI